jgi:hypothetical protein
LFAGACTAEAVGGWRVFEGYGYSFPSLICSSPPFSPANLP